MPNALITGGAKRIGRTLAQRLCREGFRVVVHYNSSAAEARDLCDALQAEGCDCALAQGDLSTRAGVEAVFRAATAAFGPVDLLINNAALFVNDDIMGVEESLFDAHFATNLKAPVHLVELLAGQDGEGEGDRLVVNILDNKVFALNPDFFTYTISKYALLGATRMMAMRFAGHPRVCGIAPSITLISGKQSEENFQKSARVNPLGRRVFPEDIADAVMFLWTTKSCNDEIITIDGGQSLLQLPRDVAFYVKEGMIDG